MKDLAHNVLSRVILFVTPPEADNEIHALFVRTSFFTVLVGLVICFFLFTFFSIRQDYVHMVTTGGIGGIAIISISLIKLSRLNSALWLTIGSAYLATMAGITANGGLNDIGMQTIFPLFILAGVLLRKRGLYSFSIVTIIWIGMLVYLDYIEFYQGLPQRYDTLTKATITITIFTFTLLILRYIIKNTFTANRELSIATREAEESNRLKTIFLTNMSHELRTPLNAIIGYSESILEEAEELNHLDQETLTDVDRIQSAGRHLLNLINDILDLSKIETDEMGLTISYFSIEDIVVEVVDTVRPQASRNRNVIDVKCSPESEIFIESDRKKLRQILLNILSNAAKYTLDGEIEFQVCVEADFNKVIFEIKDTGIGISPEDIEEIFDSFHQIDNTFSRSFQGTGLGLAITKRLVDSLNGTISVESQVGLGSAFRVELPLKFEVKDEISISKPFEMTPSL